MIDEYLSEHFYRSEFACTCGCGFDTVDVTLLYVMNYVRSYYNKKVTIDSGCRCWHRNKVVGGKSHSYHLIGRAADFHVEGILPDSVYRCIDEAFPDRFGLIVYDTFVHLDTRTGNKYRSKTRKIISEVV